MVNIASRDHHRGQHGCLLAWADAGRAGRDVLCADSKQDLKGLDILLGRGVQVEEGRSQEEERAGRLFVLNITKIILMRSVISHTDLAKWRNCGMAVRWSGGMALVPCST